MKIKRGLGRIEKDLADMSKKISCEFMSATAGQKEWQGAGVNSGTIAVAASTAKHPGVAAYLSHASNADSGYRYTTDATSILLTGGEKSTAIFKTAATLTGITRRIGYHNTSTVTAPTDGAYGKISTDGTLTGNVTKNNSITSTASSYQLLVDTFYELKFEINAAGTVTTFTLYQDDSDTVLWTDTVTAALPVVAVRHCDIATLASPAGAAIIGLIDRLEFTPAARRIH